jgi:hypothetical protein
LAADWLEAQLAEEDSRLWVFRDAADGLNNFTEKAFMGSDYADVPAMDETGPAQAGISGVTAHLDLSKHTWGGYMFLNGVLWAGQTLPGSEGWKGVDLSGAESLVFYAKGETGHERVEFFMAGHGWQEDWDISSWPDSSKRVTLGYVDLAAEWTRYELPLGGADLGDIQCGFGWVTTAGANPGLTEVRFHVDEIRYEFAEPRPGPAFLRSYAVAEPGTDEATTNNFAYLYDNAVAAIALSLAGRDERARQIADAIVYAYEHDRHYADGRLRNAYANGDPRSYPGWLSPPGYEFARLPGFYDYAAGAWSEDYFAVSTSTGNLAWAILALGEVSRRAPDPTPYLEAATGIGDFVLTLRSDQGGFTAGYEGWEPGPAKATYKSTEHNIDLVAAFRTLAELTGKPRFTEASAHAREFVLAMRDPDTKGFYTGTGDDGVTVSKDVLPLDCDTWAVLALGDSLPDAAATLAFIEQNMAVDGGYDFNQDRDGVWHEGTAQAALAYLVVGDTARHEEILGFLQRAAEPGGAITAADRDAVSTGFYVKGVGEAWNYGRRLHVGATAWLALAELGANPLA